MSTSAPWSHQYWIGLGTCIYYILFLLDASNQCQQDRGCCLLIGSIELTSKVFSLKVWCASWMVVPCACVYNVQEASRGQILKMVLLWRFSNKHYLFLECPLVSYGISDASLFGNRIPKRNRPLGKSYVRSFWEKVLSLFLFYCEAACPLVELK